MQQTFYQVLGVPPNAGDGDIRKAYYALVRQWHPDKCSAPNATSRFQAIQVREQSAYCLRTPRPPRALQIPQK
eukprot:1151173-Amphidinium_carterae.1